MENMVNGLESLTKTYAGKKVFLTGHTGFKGSWMLKLLSMLGAVVRGYALEPYTEDDLFNLIRGEQLCESVIGDVRNRELLKKEILEFQPDFVFHLAAQPLVRLSYEMPSETFEINAIGTANLLDGIKLLENPCTIVLITTDKVYHNYEWVYPYREDDRLGGYDPYSSSKACTELVINSYRNSFFNINNIQDHGKALAVGRAGNVIGGGDWSKDRLVPDIVKALNKNEAVVIRNPASVRPWQHVLEPVVGYLMLGASLFNDPLGFSEAYNFGPYASDALSVERMLNLAIGCWGSGIYRVEQTNEQLHEAALLKLDISKALSALDWQPKVNAEKAVEMTMDWYLEFFRNKNRIGEFTASQIISYLNA